MNTHRELPGIFAINIAFLGLLTLLALPDFEAMSLAEQAELVDTLPLLAGIGMAPTLMYLLFGDDGTLS